MAAIQHCPICPNQTEIDGLHKSSPQHRFNFLLFEWENYRKALINNRHGIEIKVELIQTANAPFALNIIEEKGTYIVEVTPEQMRQLEDQKIEFKCKIKNTRNSESIHLLSAFLIPHLEQYLNYFRLFDPNYNLPINSLLINPKAEYEVRVIFQLQYYIVSSFKVPVFFTFQTSTPPENQFSVVRSFIIKVSDKIESNCIHEKSPYTRSEWTDVTQIVPCTKIRRYSQHFGIPPKYWHLISSGLEEYPNMDIVSYQNLQELRLQLEPGHATPGNYRYFFRNILWLEEAEQSLNLKAYNMENVQLTLKPPDILELAVPGLAEKRPSLIYGDYVELRVHNDHICYQGVIRTVNDNSVDIAGLDAIFFQYIFHNPTTLVDVRFVLNRLQFERMHFGIQGSNQLFSLTFPNSDLLQLDVPLRINLNNCQFFDRTILENPEQRIAVTNILNRTSSTAPYIVFGPPGTGKTITIVEAILQIKQHTSKHILVCAPANAACDMLTMKLMRHCEEGELLRILSDTVDVTSLDKNLLRYCNRDSGAGNSAKVPVTDLKSYRIVVTTLVLIGRYSRTNYNPDVIFIDEAAQAGEPEALIAMSYASSGQQVVLAGDPKQLGPHCTSKVAAKYGLGLSMLDRLMELDLYATRNSHFITMLKLNYRSHPEILHIPNILFYDGLLTAVSRKASLDPVATACVYAKLAYNEEMCGYPIEFCGTHAKEQREGRSPSYFNVEEMQMVVKYIKALMALNLGKERVIGEHIGVVTPYIRQVYKIKHALIRNGITDVEVGTTETFQGREKRIIIISTVRSQNNLLLFDKRYNLGFVKHDRRFNVALTRAMSKLIIIGNPMVLGTDNKWLKVVEMCEEHNSYFGAPYIRRTTEYMNAVTSNFGNLHLRDDQYNHNDN